MKVVTTDKLGIACKVSKVNSHLSLHWHFSQTANLLQTQPILSLHISEAILILTINLDMVVRLHLFYM